MGPCQLVLFERYFLSNLPLHTSCTDVSTLRFHHHIQPSLHIIIRRHFSRSYTRPSAAKFRLKSLASFILREAAPDRQA